MSKIRLIDILISTLLFTAVISFPFSMLNLPVWAEYLVHLSFSLILLVYYIVLIRRYNIRIWKNPNIKNSLLLIPFVFIMVCNLLTMPFAYNISFNSGFFGNGEFLLYTLLLIVSAINEEIIFRLFIHTQLPIENKLLKILASAGIFGAAHLLNFFFSGFNVSVLIQVGYTFGIGIVLGFIMEYGESLIECAIFHILYNFFNTAMFSMMFNVSFSASWIYYTVIAVIAGVVMIYTLLLYVFYLRKQDYDYDRQSY